MNFVCLFPGQGSQTIGMGDDFVEHSDLARELFDQADKALGWSLSDLCFKGPSEELTLTKNSQPAILAVSYIAYRLLDQTPQAAAGHSLGEYSALVSAGSISFSDAISLVYNRGLYMQEAVPSGAGKMIAVMGPSLPELEERIKEIEVGIVQIANINSPGQTVIAGDCTGVDAFAQLVAKHGAKVIPLQVSAPFHCRLMQPAADKLKVDLDLLEIKEPNFTVYSNVTAAPHGSAEEIRECLYRQVCSSVRWTDCVNNMLEETQSGLAIEFGAGSVLSKLMKRINPQPLSRSISDMASLGTLRQSFM